VVIAGQFREIGVCCDDMLSKICCVCSIKDCIFINVCAININEFCSVGGGSGGGFGGNGGGGGGNGEGGGGDGKGGGGGGGLRGGEGGTYGGDGCDGGYGGNGDGGGGGGEGDGGGGGGLGYGGSLGGNGGENGGEGDNGGNGGKICLSLQSTQSDPYAHCKYSAPGPPSSQSPSDAYLQVLSHTLLKMQNTIMIINYNAKKSLEQRADRIS